mgnify:CR=1 FL=1
MHRAKEPDWIKDLEFGELGEKFAAFTMGWTRSPKKVKEYDLRNSVGKTIELKSDGYTTVPLEGYKLTKNMFIEEISNEELNTLGGPRRAVRDNVDFFAYLFWPNKKIYIFKSSALLFAVDFSIAGREMKRIENKRKDEEGNVTSTYTTKGYAIPIKELEGAAENVIEFGADIVEEFLALKENQPERLENL